ncbi:MAG: alpha/beta hydrolase [Herbaspirillum sp.]
MLVKVNGHDTYCYTGGKEYDANKPTAVFIHGAQHDHSVWVLQTRYFASHGYGVLAIDLPGHGRSKGTALTSVEAMADWILALLDTVGAKQATLIGHSMGSLIALETAARAPQRITHLALISTAYPMKVSEQLLNAARDDEPTAIAMVNRWSHSSVAQKPSSPGPGFFVMGANRRLMEYVSRHSTEKIFFIDFSACNAYQNGLVAAAAVICPTLFLLGKLDQMTPPKAAKSLISTIAHAQVTQIENSGHAIMAEQPDQVLDTLFQFATQ